MSSESIKQYGLILQKKGSIPSLIQRPSVFNEESDSDGSNHGERDWRAKTFQKAGAVKDMTKRHDKVQIQKALSENPSIYQYDEVYDGMKENSSKDIPKKDEKKQSRYIQSLKRNAERRKLENERRMERQVQKEREEEGEQFQNKETFVTASYKKKLQEFQKLDEEEKRIDRLEEIGDVTKQNDLSGFYRQLYKSTVDKDSKISQDSELKKGSDLKNSLDKKDAGHAEDVNQVPILSKKSQRQYRKRTKSSSSKEEGENTSSTSSSSESESDQKNQILKPDQSRNIDEQINESKISRCKSHENIGNSAVLITDSRADSEAIEDTKLSISFTCHSDESKDLSKKVSANNKSISKPEPSSNIWLKRTIGNSFDEALQKYLERKSRKIV